MLLTLIVILILIGSAVVGSLYSNFLVFYENFSETENYHKARYASIAAIERAELVIKQREPGFEGSGGRIRSENKQGSDSDKMPNGTGFSYLSENSPQKSTVYRTIKSKTSRIPSTGNGNVEKLLSANDSPNYNMMDYENAEIFLLYYDKDDYEHPYAKKSCSTPGQCEKTKLSSIKVGIRLPAYIRDKFYVMGKIDTLDTSEPLIKDGGYQDDALVDRQIRGKYGDAAFTVFATQEAMGYSTGPNDSAIRESHLNNLSGLTFSFSNTRNPITNRTSNPTIISPQDSYISGRPHAFNALFTEGDFKDLQLRLSLLNLVLGGGKVGTRYPFLEYYIDIQPTGTYPVIASDRYFTIETEGNFGDYKINNVLYKPTITESILRSFTTIF